jgi:hypothetical protein
MSHAKPWQIAVVALGLIGGIGGIVYSVRSNPGLDLAKSILYVDAQTGELYEIDIPSKGSLGIPEKNPSTGKDTLLPVFQDDSGSWRVSERYKSALSDMGLKPDELAVDPKTGLVKVKEGNPKKVSK